jgi:C1A family cysteine protease
LTSFLRSNSKFLIVGLIAASVVGNYAQGRRHRHSNRSVYVRGERKIYPLLTPTGMFKSDDQMKAEAYSGRHKFNNVFERGPDPEKTLLQYTTPVRDQGHRGTCVAFATMALMETELKARNGQDTDLSEQYAYWASKAIEKVNPNADGSDPSGMLEAMADHGTALESEWRYETEPWFADRTHHKDCVEAYKSNPDDIPTECVTNGDPSESAARSQKVTIGKHGQVETSPEAIVGYLENNVPVELAVDVYKHAWHFDQPDSDAFKSGVVDMPARGDRPIGGHAILIVGYSVQGKYYVFKNSWGTDEWGSRSQIRPGYGIIPIDYVRKYGEASVAQVN